MGIIKFSNCCWLNVLISLIMGDRCDGLMRNVGDLLVLPRSGGLIGLMLTRFVAFIFSNRCLSGREGTSDAGQFVHNLVCHLAVFFYLLGVLNRDVGGFFGLTQSFLELTQPNSQFRLSHFRCNFEEKGIRTGIEFEFILHGNDRFG